MRPGSRTSRAGRRAVRALAPLIAWGAAALRGSNVAIAQGRPTPTPVASTARVPWRDPSPHVARQVPVAPGVRLEVLEWGGPAQGGPAGGAASPPLVFLAGGGNTAHVYDGFAPRFASRFRVLGVTRRGVGDSSRPDTGYRSATLARDVVAVLDSLGIARATFVAHSFGGSELHALAVRYPGRVAGLVYLDAAYDYRVLLDSPEWAAGALRSWEPPWPAYAGETVADWTRFAERVSGPCFPEAEVRALFVFDAAGRWVRSNTPDSTQARYNRGVEAVDVRRARAPALALYAVPSSPEAMFPFWAALDSTGRARDAQVFAAVTGIHARLRARFRRDVPQARVVEIHGARHYVFLTHPAEAEHAMLEFLLPASGGPAPASR